MPDGNLARLARALPLFATLSMAAALIGCANIHPAPDDPGTGMLESPTDEADQLRRSEERAEEDRDQEGERRQ